MNIDIDVICEYGEARALFEDLNDVCQTSFDSSILLMKSAFAFYADKHPGRAKDCVETVSQFMDLLLKVKSWQGTIQKQNVRIDKVSDYFEKPDIINEKVLLSLLTSKN